MFDVNALWVGDRINRLHAACLKSFLECGHHVRLHTYGNVAGVPKGVELFDARKLMAEDEIVRHRRSKSLALASDVYRYRIMKAGLGAYVDCDVYCVRPLPEDEYLFGWEADDVLGSAVLRFPESSPVLAQMNEAASNPYFVPWWGRPLRIYYQKFRRMIGVPVHVSRQKWGTIGPLLVHNAVKLHGLLDRAQPMDVLFPVSPIQSTLLNDPGLTLRDLCTPRTRAVHLWNTRTSQCDFREGSILYEISREAD